MNSSPLRSLSVVEILDGAVALFRRDFFADFLFVLVLGAVGGLTPYLLGLDQSLSGVTYSVVAYLIGLPFEGAAMAAVLWRAGRQLEGESHTLGQTVRVAARFGLPVGGIDLLATCAILLGTSLFIVPGMIIAAGLALVAPCIVLDGTSPTLSFTRSWNLVRGRLWRTFGLVALIYFLTDFQAQMALGSVGFINLVASPVVGASNGVPTIEIILFKSAILALVRPIKLSAIVLIHRDARARSESDLIRFQRAASEVGL